MQASISERCADGDPMNKENKSDIKVGVAETAQANVQVPFLNL